MRPRPGGWAWLRLPAHSEVRRTLARTAQHDQLLAARGSIPAQAGEPITKEHATTYQRVYPRAGGGTQIETLDKTREAGLSPRRRGNPQGGCLRIPLPGVYPRAGGGTSNTPTNGQFLWGLSPRRRGNLTPPAGAAK